MIAPAAIPQAASFSTCFGARTAYGTTTEAPSEGHRARVVGASSKFIRTQSGDATVAVSEDKSMRWVFNAPPGWPAPPAGWMPPQGWQPPPEFPTPPPDGSCACSSTIRRPQPCHPNLSAGPRPQHPRTRTCCRTGRTWPGGDTNHSHPGDQRRAFRGHRRTIKRRTYPRKVTLTSRSGTKTCPFMISWVISRPSLTADLSRYSRKRSLLST